LIVGVSVHYQSAVVRGPRKVLDNQVLHEIGLVRIWGEVPWRFDPRPIEAFVPPISRIRLAGGNLRFTSRKVSIV
jgi:hypothetical protein